MSRIELTHPRRSRLLAWLDTGADERVTEHVGQCDRCAQRLEELAAEPGSPALDADIELGDAIRAAMAPPDDLNERVLRRIEARQLAERELSLFLGLIAIPRDAMDLMMPPAPHAQPLPPPQVGPAHETQREELE